MRYLLPLVCISGCVVGPLDGDDFQGLMLFRGFAYEANADVTVEVFRRSTSTWVPRATFSAESSPTTLGGDSLYYWEGYVQMIPTGEDRRCYARADCGSTGGIVEARARTSPSSNLATFDSDGLACVADRLDDGDSWLNAGMNCAADISPIVRLPTVQTGCDAWTQLDCGCDPGDCAETEQVSTCVWWSNNGTTFNDTRCRPVLANHDGVGDPCTVVDSAVSGIDTCGYFAMCWNVDPNTLQGTCRQICNGSEAYPFCDDPDHQCTIDGTGTVSVCAPPGS